jgi:predicted TIM-barrel fold metal-dependent hydrolase
VKPPFPSRRDALAAFAGAAAGVALHGAAGAQTTDLRGLVDVHHHFYPPQLTAAANAMNAKHGAPPISGPDATWTPARTLEEMDASGISVAILSLSSFRGVWFEQPQANWAPLARACNEYAADLIREHPHRFGLFATLPMPDVDASLKEIPHALDTLHADGIGLPTSFGNRWPGDPAFAPVWDELNRRKAIVVFHPLAPACCTNLIPHVGDSYIEYPYDTGRAVLSLLFNGALAKYRDIRWTFCHGGGPVPVLAQRVATLVRGRNDLSEIAPNGIVSELQRLYFDTANAAYAPSMAALLAFVPVSQIMFGTDYPYVPGKTNVDALVARNLPPATLAAIAHDNAARLIPRLGA